jgi:hypothetical protein
MTLGALVLAVATCALPTLWLVRVCLFSTLTEPAAAPA